MSDRPATQKLMKAFGAAVDDLKPTGGEIIEAACGILIVSMSGELSGWGTAEETLARSIRADVCIRKATA
jgi:hypothetical protein